jgi:hypothetical protein
MPIINLSTLPISFLEMIVDSLLFSARAVKVDVMKQAQLIKSLLNILSMDRLGE